MLFGHYILNKNKQMKKKKFILSLLAVTSICVFGKAVIRKRNGNHFIDTNNSTNDFNADVTPSLF